MELSDARFLRRQTKALYPHHRHFRDLTEAYPRDRSSDWLEGLELTPNEGTLVPWHSVTARPRAAPPMSEACAPKLPTQNATASVAAQHGRASRSDRGLRRRGKRTTPACRGQ